jgi:Bacterial SH3 domain
MSTRTLELPRQSYFVDYVHQLTIDRPRLARRFHTRRRTIVGTAVLVFGSISGGTAHANVGSWRGGVCVVDVAADDVLWLRAAPNAKAKKVGSLRPNNCEDTSTYAYFDGRRNGQWVKLRTASGVKGWANERFLISYPAWDAST